jgi:oxygen-independent coproporphyrinogen-3 oxidase
MPFCAKRCYFCSFNTAPMDEGALKQYVRALHREIELVAMLPWASDVGIETIFFGGGTPSLLPPATLDGILEALRTRLRVGRDIEITVECNPESVSSDSLAGYHDAGVNRISLGVQSLDDALLARVGRLHDGRGARAAFEAARHAGFTNVSVDLMYGLPGLDVARWSSTVDQVLAWNPEHVSAYGLTLDAGSLWGARGIGGLPDEDTVVEQYWVLARAAAARGFEHYEVSNYALPGFRSRHNQVYWRRGEYLACGPGAAGFIGDLRWSNVRPVGRYCALLDAGRLPVDTWERLSARQTLGERLFLGLRTIDGVPSAWLAERAEGDDVVATRLDLWRQQGWLDERGGRVRLTESGFLLSDALFVELL